MNRGPFYEKKTHSVEQKLERGTLWDFSLSVLSQRSKTIEGGPLREKFPEKKSRNAEKTERGTFRLRPVLYVTRGTFLVQFYWPTGTIWRLKTL